MAALFQIGSSIPVLRMSDEAGAKAFYVDFLGFEIISGNIGLKTVRNHPFTCKSGLAKR